MREENREGINFGGFKQKALGWQKTQGWKTERGLFFGAVNILAKMIKKSIRKKMKYGWVGL